MRVATFQLRGHESAALESLIELGFMFDQQRAVTTTVLDTFDGRLHRAGLRLQLIESDHAEIELTGEGTAPAHLTVAEVPRFADDLPPGLIRSRVAVLVDVRVLLPQLRMCAARTRGEWQDATGEVVVVADLYENVRVVDRPDVDCSEATIEIYEVPGHGKPALDSIEALNRVGGGECEADTLTQCAAAAGIDLAGFTVTATVPLDPEMSAIDGCRLVLANLATTISANWQGTIDQADPEFLHDLRIAVRRTRTILAEAKAVLPDAAREPAQDGFAWLADLTGPPRDLDVYLLEWSRYTDPIGDRFMSSLEPVRELLERRCADAHIELEGALRSVRAIDLIGTWSEWLTEPLGHDDLPTRARRPLGRLVAKRIARAHGVVLKGGRLIGPETPGSQIHDLRKDAKKLRYLLECFGSLLPKRARKRYVKRLKALQDSLGEYQDAEVHLGVLREIARELRESGASPDTMVAIGQLTERLDQQRLAARAEFAARFADYDSRATRRAFDAVLDSITE